MDFMLGRGVPQRVAAPSWGGCQLFWVRCCTCLHTARSRQPSSWPAILPRGYANPTAEETSGGKVAYVDEGQITGAGSSPHLEGHR